eukprot:CAMPEP_0197662620 /NCGR_PEP_ID=MMETSP1338-20131121/54143_1 /TAXON_ID=43686 ORGANISM="Pelagodinium beii, Strain RCC1491" /NCGR_SAMPLE_ID=MMETSP1338 /ASSEMBLY_ACC=CAM_ASM_000754 /LENGTH=581 /DNA_ID=CAMNT_0043240547 /DNA_START=37 /DNA_END=1783 /DNA_ORIENTATION=+
MAALPSSVDTSLNKLKEGAQAWAALPDTERAAVARACRQQLATLDLAWEEDNMKCLGIDPSKRDFYNTLGFDPFLFIATTADRLDKVADFLEGKLKDLSKEAKRQLPESGPLVYAMGGVGQAAPGCEIELWASADQSGEAAQEESEKGASIVLGAGNQNFLTSVDVIERAFRAKECVFLKHHPIRPFMAEAFAHIFAPLAEKGAYAQCLDGDLAGAHEAFICHKSVTHVHMTGSGATHDRIVASLKKAGRADEVAFTSELGCVSPWIICPGTVNDGKWEDAAIEHHTTMLTSAFKSSCSMNCLSPKVLVLPSEELWPQRTAFLAALQKKMAEKPDMPPYYPGAHQRYAAFEKEYSDAQKIEAPPAQPAEEAVKAPYGGQDFKILPSLLVNVGTIGAADCKPYALKTEAFAPVLAIATVDCQSAKEFPMAAAQAVNKHLFGNLSCTMVCPDERDEVLDKALNELDYGCVALNMWVALAYGNAFCVWGAAPGKYTPENPQSGTDFVGNAANVPNVKKGVVTSPFLNKGVAMDKPLPMIVADCLTVLASGKNMVLPRILASSQAEPSAFFREGCLQRMEPRAAV